MSTGPSDAPAEDPAVPALKTSERHPLAFWFFFWGEFAERSSFYGMKTILPIYLATGYLSGGLGLSTNQAATATFWFKMGAYLLPLLGGFLADRYFGKYWVIVGFSVPYVLGHFILGIPHGVTVGIALVLLAAGSGAIKPNLSALMGQTYDQQRPGQERLRSAAFLWYYFAINVGSLLSTLALPELRSRYGFAIAFQFPSWLMVVALAIFASGRSFYATDSLDRSPLTPEQRSTRRETLERLFGIFGLMVLFWFGYEQADTLWVFFMRDYVNLNIPGWSTPIPPEQLQSINPLCVLLMVPLFNGFFRWVDPQVRVFTAVKKMLIGFVLGATASGIMAVAGLITEFSGAKVSILWPSVAYVVLTAAEVLLYGTGLEFAYAIASKNMKGFITACFLLTIALADLANAGLARLYGGSLVDLPKDRGPLPPSAFFGLTAMIVVLATIAFYFVGRRFDAASAAKAAPE